jgi:DNA-directed RNA polymerase specialized sigma24 family protein
LVSASGAMRNARDFRGQAALRTWVFSILKFKIADILRQKVRQGIAMPLDEIDDALADGMFRPSGRWQDESRPSEWADPEQSLESALIGYQAGTVDFPRVLDAEMTLFGYQRERLESRMEYLMDVARLEALIGEDPAVVTTAGEKEGDR